MFTRNRVSIRVERNQKRNKLPVLSVLADVPSVEGLFKGTASDQMVETGLSIWR